MLPNANSFNDLQDEDKLLLLNYIAENFHQVQNINPQYSAYGLKARFNRLTGSDKNHHITSQCFMEAMVASGYKAVQIPDTGEANWRFNIGKIHFTD
mgnify:CR=1 FL=1